MPKQIDYMSVSRSSSDRILVTPSAYAKKHYLYVQEAGSLKSLEPHISSRKNLHSVLFLIVTEGSGTLRIDTHTSPLRAGDFAFIDCRVPYSHESSAEDPWTLRWVHFYGEDVTHFLDAYREQGLAHVFHPVDLTPFQTLLSEIYECSRSQGFLEELQAHRYLTDLIALVFSAQSPAENAQQSKLSMVREYLEHHLSEKLTLDSLAETFFMSKYHLSREYHRAFGATLVSDLNSLRISHAKSQLRFSDSPVEEIAESSGFSDSAYFVHVFKTAEGITPLQYRKRWRGNKTMV